ncbi:hypothetical protein KY285_010005 [Solanum tuberosum]|nr:hypothetical protein KY285_010005 [Solanum tuberosum]
MTTNMCVVSPPPKPPDPPELSFKEALINKEKDLNLSYNHGDDIQMFEKEQEDGPIILSEGDKQRIYSPWKFSVIIKLYGKKIAHNYLKGKLTDLWNPIEPLNLIDLGCEFYIAKFNKQESMNKAPHEVSWFVTGSFPSVRRWEPNFVLNESMEYHIAIWTRWPQLPTKFYDKEVLEKIGKKLGRLLKIDLSTSATLRGRYARICIQVSIGNPLQNEVQIGTHTQKVVYEGEGILCTCCGTIGHVLRNCPHKKKFRENPSSQATSAETKDEAWHVVTFPKIQKSPKWPPQANMELHREWKKQNSRAPR